MVPLLIIMWAEDYPFVKTGKAAQFLEDLPISQSNKEKIGHGTAEKLFKL
ncbi:amidohydrolase family protein [Secundilactobacillus hailunensis]|nr:amidohydrolase family protein [Secundilactobacillus hailunensis]